MPRGSGPAAGRLSLRLPFRRPLWPDNLFGHLAATAVPGVEERRDGSDRRTLRLPHGAGVAALAPRTDHVDCRLTLADGRDLGVAITRCRRLLDLDADPVAIDEQLGRRAASSTSVPPWIGTTPVARSRGFPGSGPARSR